MGDERRITCVNDHEVGAGARFCSQCGAEIDTDATAATSPPGSIDSLARRPPRRLTWWQVASIFAVIGLVVYLAVVRPAMNSEARVKGNDSPVQPSYEYSPAAACYDSIAPAVDYMINNNGSDAALNEVILEFGTNDPRFRLTVDTYSAWSVEASLNGRDSANLLATERISNWCEENS